MLLHFAGHAWFAACMHVVCRWLCIHDLFCWYEVSMCWLAHVCHMMPRPLMQIKLTHAWSKGIVISILRAVLVMLPAVAAAGNLS